MLGVLENLTEVHLITYSRKKRLINFCSELSNEEQNLIARQTYSLIKDINSICFHHKSLLLVKYSHLERYCSNPFGMVNRCSLKGLRNIDLEIADCLSKLRKKSFAQVKNCVQDAAILIQLQALQMNQLKKSTILVR